MGDTNPAYPDIAPPTMLQAWTMGGLAGHPVGSKWLSEQDDVRFRKPARCFCVLDQLRGDLATGQLGDERPALLDRARHCAEDLGRVVVRERLANGGRVRMGEHGRAVDPLPQLDRDRRGRADASFGERLRLLADHLTEHVGLQVALVAAGREQPPDCSRDGADAGSRGCKATAGLAQLVEEVLAGSLVPLDQLGERLNGLARHPAGSM